MTPSQTPTQSDEITPIPVVGSSDAAITGGPDPRDALTAFLRQLLELQCGLVGGAAGVVFLNHGPGNSPAIAATYHAPSCERLTEGTDPLGPATLPRLERLSSQTAGTIESITLARPGRGMYGEELRLRALSAPLAADGRIEGTCIVLTPAPGRQTTPPDSDALRLIELAAARFETFLWRQQCFAEAEQKLMLRETVELLDASQQGGTAAAMGSILCQELKRRFGATRVSIGLVQRDFIRLVAVSGADQIDRNAAAVEAIEAAMEESAAQDCEIVFPVPPGTDADPAQRRVTRAHEDLSRRFGPAAMLSLPLRVEGDLVGVALLEREADQPFPLGAAALLRLVAETIGPALWTRRLADRGIWAVSRDRTRELAVELVGPRHTGMKLIGAIIALAFLGAAVIPIPSRVSAHAEVRPAAARTIVPPFTGFLAAVSVKPGDHVSEGQVLAEMDVSEVQLQLAQAASDRASLTTQQTESLNRGELAKAKQLEYDAAKAHAVMQQAEGYLRNAQIRSPINGVVGKGDLEQFVRAKVEPTQPLFEIVTDANICVAYVDERDIQRVSKGQSGRFVSRALPDDKLPVRVVRITPVAEPRQGTNSYEVELESTEQGGAWRTLRPGMTGKTKLDDGWTTTLATLLRPIVDELRLRWWW